MGHIALATRAGRTGAAFKVNEEHCPAARAMARTEMKFLISQCRRRVAAPLRPLGGPNAGKLKSQHQVQGGEETMADFDDGLDDYQDFEDEEEGGEGDQGGGGDRDQFANVCFPPLED